MDVYKVDIAHKNGKKLSEDLINKIGIGFSHGGLYFVVELFRREENLQEYFLREIQRLKSYMNIPEENEKVLGGYLNKYQEIKYNIKKISEEDVKKLKQKRSRQILERIAGL